MKNKPLMIPLLLLLLLLLLPMIFQASAASASSCNNTKTLEQVEECRPAVDSKNGTGKPTTACCSKLRIVKSTCLCALLDEEPPKGIDLTKAARLPAQCGLNGPDTC